MSDAAVSKAADLADGCRQPRIAIIIAVWNAAASLRNCLDSICSQNYKHKEIIVIDSASTDGSVDILREFDDRLHYWESAPDRGIAHAWNKGLDHTQADWILFLGADDVLADDTVLADVAALLRQDKQHDVVYGCVSYVDGSQAGAVYGQPYDPAVMKRNMIVPHNACFHRLALFEELGPYDETYRIAIDYEFFLRKETFRARFIPKICALLGGYGVSRQQTARLLLEAHRARIKNRTGLRFKLECWHLWQQFYFALDRLLCAILRKIR